MRRVARDAYLVASVVTVAIVLTDAVSLGWDGHAYWLARLPAPYNSGAYGVTDGFYYSPAFAQAIAPLTLLPWPVFNALIVAAGLASLYWLVGPWALPAVLLPPVMIDISSANITLLLAATMVVGFRYPVAWAPILLTKVLPGVGVLWFAARAEWQAMAIAMGTTAAIVVVSFALMPSLWFDWLAVLRSSEAQPPPTAYAWFFAPRLVVAVALIVLGARTRRAWLVPVATVLATPVIWPYTLAFLLAIPRLRNSWNPDRSLTRSHDGLATHDGSGKEVDIDASGSTVPVTERTTGT